MQEFFNIVFSVGFGYSILRVTTPILFAALGALISDKAGVINIALEGIMLISALIGVIVSAGTGSVWIGLLAAVIIGGIIGIVMAYFSLNLKSDIILTGIEIGEHTSELQSRQYLVCRLLLEKKKTIKT